MYYESQVIKRDFFPIIYYKGNWWENNVNNDRIRWLIIRRFYEYEIGKKIWELN